MQIDETAKAFEQMAGKVADTSDSINRYASRSGAGVQQFSQQTLPEFGALISELRRLADMKLMITWKGEFEGHLDRCGDVDHAGCKHRSDFGHLGLVGVAVYGDV